MQQRLRNAESLFHSMRECLDLALGPLVQSDDLQHPHDIPVAHIRPRQPPQQLHILVRREVVVEVGSLHDRTNAPQDIVPVPVKGLAKKLDAAGCWFDQRQHHSNGGALSGTIGTEEAVDVTLVHGQFQTINSGEIAVALRQPPKFGQLWVPRSSIT